MATGSYSNLFVVIATSAATLIGLLFVALSVSGSRSGSRPKVVRQFRAGASFLAFINALSVTLFGLVPGTNVGIPALVLGVTGVLFAAAGIRQTFRAPSRRNFASEQPVLVTFLLLVFGFEMAYGIILINNINDRSALANIGNILIASLLVGIARAWELVGDWNTGIWSSIMLLVRPSADAADAGPGAPDEPGAGDLDRAPNDHPE
jgi:hypothetical protein